MAERKRNADGTFRKKRRSRKGLGEAESRGRRVRRAVTARAPKYIDGAKKGLSVLAGFVMGGVGRGFLNKMLPAPAAGGTGINTSSLMVDIALVGGGVYLATQSKNELLQYAGYGMAANGVAGAIKSITQKDLLSTGLSGTDLSDVVAGLGLGAAQDEVSGLGNMQMIDLSTIAPSAPVRGIAAPDEMNGMGAASSALYQDMGAVDYMGDVDAMVA